MVNVKVERSDIGMLIRITESDYENHKCVGCIMEKNGESLLDLKIIKGARNCKDDGYCSILRYEKYKEISKVDEAVMRLEGVI